MYNGFGQFCNGLFSFGRFPYGGALTMIIGVVLILVVLYLIFRKSGGFSASTVSESESPLETLQKRYVNGEIDKEEYLEKKDILKGKADPIPLFVP